MHYKHRVSGAGAWEYWKMEKWAYENSFFWMSSIILFVFSV